MLKLAVGEMITQADVSDLAAISGWSFVDKIPPTDKNPLEIVWATQDRQNLIHYVEDEWIGVHYLAFDGPAASNLAFQVCQSGRLFYRLEDVLSRVEREEEPKEQVKTASMLGILAPDKFELRSFEAFKKLLSSPSPAVRQITILAIAYRGWPECVTLLAHIKEHDPEDFVRWRAEVALQAYMEVRQGKDD